MAWTTASSGAGGVGGLADGQVALPGGQGRLVEYLAHTWLATPISRHMSMPQPSATAVPADS